jgi:menaquinone-dependent protoporphyrinogen IX oxidase
MNIIVLFNSKTGFTEKYANWIAQEIKCDIKSYKSISSIDLKKYDLVIYGTRIHAGKTENINIIKNLFKNHILKELIVFVTGATPNFEEKQINKMWINNFNENELKNIAHYYFQSGLNYERMNIIDKIMMKMLSYLLSRKKEKTQNEIGTELAIQKSHDVSSKEYIIPLIEYIKERMRR